MSITSELFFAYRECARTIWNSYILGGASDLNDVERFQQICQRLFDAIVLAKLDITIPIQEIGRKPIPQVKINAKSLAGVPILINRESGKRSGYWDDPFNNLLPDKADLVFVDFFDWDVLTYIDLQYYLVLIQSFEEHPELIGRYALIEVQHAVPTISELHKPTMAPELPTNDKR